MLTQLTRNWALVMLRGFVAIVFGLVALLMPLATLGALVLLFGAFAVADGVFAVIAAFTHRESHDRWWVLLLEGLLGIGAGVIVFLMPGIATLVLITMIAVWAVVTGVLEVVAAVQLRKEIEGEWLLGLSGVVSVIFGILLLAGPAIVTALTVAWLIGVYAILFGASLMGLGWRLRKLATHEQVLVLKQAGSPAAHR